MPSPLVHITAGFALGGLSSQRYDLHLRIKWILFCLFFSMAPDLDVLAGILAGDFAAYHNQITHSIFFGLGFCLLALPVLKWIFGGISGGRLLAFAYGFYVLHLILDWMTYGRGLMLFWPFTSRRFISPWLPFRGVRWSEGVFSMEHLLTLANEVAILLVAAVLVYVSRTVWLLVRRRS